jgi:anti-sigma-K factor RskA
MDYGQRLLADRLAAAYASGVLRGAARRRYEALLPSHPALREALRAWNDRLMPLTATLEPVEPPARVWERIVERIGLGAAPAAGASAPRARTRGLGFWRAFAGVASTAAVALAVALALPGGGSEPPVLVVLTAMSGAADAPGMPARAPAAIVASYMPRSDEMVAMPVAPMDPMPDRSLHLWAIPSGGGAPRSLGLVTGEGGVMPMRAEALRGAAQLAVSLEPKGGSPGPGPTGPVVYAGAIKAAR